MRIGVLRYPVRTTDGLAHYETVFLDALAEAALTSNDEIVCLAGPENDFFSRPSGLSYRGLPIKPMRDTVFRQEAPESYLVPPQAGPELDPKSIPFDKEHAAAYGKAGVNLVLQLGPYAYPFLARVPFVIPIFDLNHRLQPEFPEVSALGEYNRREFLYIKTCRFATFVLVDSEAGKADVLKFYGDQIAEDRIRVLPYPFAKFIVAEAAKPGGTLPPGVNAVLPLARALSQMPEQRWRNCGADAEIGQIAVQFIPAITSNAVSVPAPQELAAAAPPDEMSPASVFHRFDDRLAAGEALERAKRLKREGRFSRRAATSNTRSSERRWMSMCSGHLASSA